MTIGLLQPPLLLLVKVLLLVLFAFALGVVNFLGGGGDGGLRLPCRGFLRTTLLHRGAEMDSGEGRWDWGRGSSRVRGRANRLGG